MNVKELLKSIFSYYLGLLEEYEENLFENIS